MQNSITVNYRRITQASSNLFELAVTRPRGTRIQPFRVTSTHEQPGENATSKFLRARVGIQTRARCRVRGRHLSVDRTTNLYHVSIRRLSVRLSVSSTRYQLPRDLKFNTQSEVVPLTPEMVVRMFRTPMSSRYQPKQNGGCPIKISRPVEAGCERGG